MKPSELIRQYGWVQNEPGSYRCGLCVVNALGIGVGSDVYEERCKRLRDKLQISSVSLWNDAPGRTKEEVIALLEGEGL
jgi:hypothetical protein